MRDANFADIVVLLTGASYGSLLGFSLPANDASKAFAVVVINSAAGSAMGSGFTATHEVGHLTNARHQRCGLPLCNLLSTQGCDNATKFHGHVFNTTAGLTRTVMAQNNCGGTRILRWSNPDVSFMSVSTGDTKNKDFQTIKDRAAFISCFRGSPPTNTNIFGLELYGNTTVCSGSGFAQYSVGLNPFGVAYPLSYSWEISAVGTGGFTQVGTGSTYVLTNASSLPNPFFLRVTVTDSGGKHASVQMSISTVSCLGGGVDDRAETTESALEKTTLYPNPTSGIVNVLQTTPTAQFKITDSTGRALRMEQNMQNAYHSFDLSTLPAGMYYLSVVENDFLKVFKVVKL